MYCSNDLTLYRICPTSHFVRPPVTPSVDRKAVQRLVQRFESFVSPMAAPIQTNTQLTNQYTALLTLQAHCGMSSTFKTKQTVNNTAGWK